MITCVGVMLALVSWSRVHRSVPVKPALAFHMEGGTLIDGGYLRETSNNGITVSFAEGTKFTLMPGARGRLRSVDSAGARIAVDDGAASFQVTPRSDARWLVDVGPFLITVRGTVFDVNWDQRSERFEIMLKHGRVTVSGPASGGDIALRAGQRLVVNLSKSETIITEEPPEDAIADSGVVVNDGASIDIPSERASNEVAQKHGSESSAPASKATLSRWGEVVAAADWDRILRDAEAAGLRKVIETATSEDLFALADAARYRQRMNLARDALLAERRRFPSSPRALDAAYLLGRVEESSERGLTEALKWYDEYLARAPTGTYASESLGRKMILTKKLSGIAQARPLAEAYLQRFPNGTYSGAARALRRAQ
jgi:TolA-binding protein